MQGAVSVGGDAGVPQRASARRVVSRATVRAIRAHGVSVLTVVMGHAHRQSQKRIGLIGATWGPLVVVVGARTARVRRGVGRGTERGNRTRLDGTKCMMK